MEPSHFLLVMTLILYAFECYRVRTAYIISSARYLYAIILIFSVTFSFLFSIFDDNSGTSLVMGTGAAIMAVLFLFYFWNENA